MDIKKAYIVMQDKYGIGVGDKVKVLRYPKSYEMGWNCEPGGKSIVGETCIVKAIQDQSGIQLDSGNKCIFWWYPFFCLEIIEKAKVIRKEVRYFDETGKDVTDSISEETKQNLEKGNR